MRCILTPKVAHTVTGRLHYFIEAVRLWMIPFGTNNGFVEMRSIPISCEDICIIIGHRDEIKQYLRNATVPEKTIVLITCQIDVNFIKRFLPQKMVYISKQTDGYSVLLKGDAYGFDFDITKSELIFYNKKHIRSIIDRIESSFMRVA